MRRYVLACLILAALPVGLSDWAGPVEVTALDNGVKLTNNSGSALTNHPVWFGRWFAEGELANYSRPFVTPQGGSRVAAATWQVDEKLRWRDATAVRTLTNVLAAQPSWTSTGGGGTATASVSGNILTLNTGTPHNLTYGDALIITGTPTDADMKNGNPYLVHSVPSNTTVLVTTRGGISSTLGTWVLRHVIDERNTSGMRFTSPNHGFEIGDTVTGSGVGGVPEANGTFIITGVSRDHFVVNAAGTGTYTPFTGSVSGPAPGSLKHALVALFITIPTGETAYIDFVNDSNPCSSGDRAACDAAGFDKTEALAASWEFAVDFTAPVASGHTATFTRNARTILTDWNETQLPCGPRYWMRGPVVTELILENNCIATDTASITVSSTNASTPYDFGWRMVGTGAANQTLVTAVSGASSEVGVSSLGGIANGGKLWINNATSNPQSAEVMLVNGTPSTAVSTCDGQAITLGTNACVPVLRQQDDSALLASIPIGRVVSIWQWQDARVAVPPTTSPDYSIRPSFRLKFIPGWSGVGVTIGTSNSQWGKWQNQWYSVDIRTGAVLPIRKSIPTFKHASKTSWKFSTWDGSDPEFGCKDQGSDPENCASVILQQGVSLNNIVVSGSNITGTATVNCTGLCGVSVGEWVLVEGVTTIQPTDPNRQGWNMNGLNLVTGAGSNTFTFVSRTTGLGTYADSTITISRGTRRRKVLIDHNTPYMIHSKLLLQWRMYNSTKSGDWRTGFWNSNRGQLGGLRREQDYTTKILSSPVQYIFPGRYMGWGRWGADPVDGSEAYAGSQKSRAMTDFPNDTQEGWVLQTDQVAWLHTWDEAGYDYTLGDSTPGGVGGNANIQAHLPIQATEDGLRNIAFIDHPYMPGFGERAFGRPVSNFARRANWNNTFAQTATMDRPTTPCAVTAAPTLIASGNAQWPCSSTGGFLIGNDGWSIEPAHQNEYTWLAYVITGDYSLLRTLENQGAWNCGQSPSKNAAGNIFIKPWCIVETGTAGSGIHIRAESQPIRHGIRLAGLYPNVPQWGQTTVPVEHYYYQQQTWDMAFQEEGGGQITDGWYNTLYGFQGISMDCSGYDTSDRVESPWHMLRCGTGKYNNIDNPLHWPMAAWGSGSCGSPPTCDPVDCRYLTCTSGSTFETSTWMFTFSNAYYAQSAAWGLKPFRHAFRKLSDIMVNMAGSQLINKFLVITYDTPAPRQPDLTFKLSFADYRDGYAATWPYNLANGTGATMERDNLTSCNISSTQTGGTCGEAIGYPTRVKAGVAVSSEVDQLGANTHAGCTPADVPPNGCTVQTAVDRLNSYITANYSNNARYDIRPRETIIGLTATPGLGTVTLTYTPNTSDNCTYQIDPSNSLDTGAVNDGQTTIGLRSVGPISISDGTHRAVVKCGQRGTAAFGPVNGTTQSSVEFQVGAPISGATMGRGATAGRGATVK